MSDIFVSYKREDGGKAKALVAALRDAGFATFWDQDISPGANWQFALEAALDDARLCLVLWSRHSIGPEGHFVREEARRATQRGAYLGVLVDPVLPPLGFGEWQAFDATGWSGGEGDLALDGLIAHIRKRLDLAEPPPEPRPRRSIEPHPPSRSDSQAKGRGTLLRRGLVAGLLVSVLLVGIASYGGAAASRCELQQNDAVAHLRSAANQLHHRNELLVGRSEQDEQPPIHDGSLRRWWTGEGDQGASAGRHARSLVGAVFSPAHGLEIADEDGRYMTLPPIDEIIEREGGELRGVLLPLFTGPAEGPDAARLPEAPADDLRAAIRWLDERVTAYTDPASLRIAGGCGFASAFAR